MEIKEGGSVYVYCVYYVAFFVVFFFFIIIMLLAGLKTYMYCNCSTLLWFVYAILLQNSFIFYRFPLGYTTDINVSLIFQRLL